jgi:hypothetical protein
MRTHLKEYSYGVARLMAAMAAFYLVSWGVLVPMTPDSILVQKTLMKLFTGSTIIILPILMAVALVIPALPRTWYRATFITSVTLIGAVVPGVFLFDYIGFWPFLNELGQPREVYALRASGVILVLATAVAVIASFLAPRRHTPPPAVDSNYMRDTDRDYNYGGAIPAPPVTNGGQ